VSVRPVFVSEVLSVFPGMKSAGEKVVRTELGTVEKSFMRMYVEL